MGCPPAPRVLARDSWLGGLPDGVGASSAPKLPKNSKQPPTTRAGRTSIKPLNALASRCKVECWIWFLSVKYGGEITDSWVSPCVCIYVYVFFGLPKLQTDRQQDPQMQTHRHADRDTQTECGKTRKEGRVGQRNIEKKKKGQSPRRDGGGGVG